MRYKPHLALLLCNLVWATDYPFYRLMLPRYATATGLACASLTLAALFSLVPLLWQRRERVARADAFRFVGAALLIGVMRKLFLMKGLSLTSPIDGSIIDTVVPVLVLILSVLLGIDRFTRRKVVGIVLGLAGAVGVIVMGGSATHGGSHLGGNVLILLCAMSTAVYMVWFKRLLERYRISTALRWVYCLSALMVLPFGARDALHIDVAAMDTLARFALIYVLVLPTYGPNLLLNYALKHVTPTVSSIYTYLQPVVATILAVAMGLDRLHADTVIGAAVIFAGVWLVLSSYRTPQAAPSLRRH